MNDRTIINSCSLPLNRDIGLITPKTDNITVKKYRADFIVTRDEMGNLCAADMERGIFTDGIDKNELIKNIHEAVECYFDVPTYGDVEIHIKYE